MESLEPFNVLINYWWNPHLAEIGPSANSALMASVLSMASMDQPQREAWRSLFDYFVFKRTGNPAEHLPNDLNGIATQLSEKELIHCLDFLRDQLKP